MSAADMTRLEKENLVIDLYKRNKTMNEIAQTVHMSFRDIGRITKRVQLEVDRERGYINNDDEVDMESKSKEAQALKMFSEGKSPLDVAVKLELNSTSTEALYQDYWRLKGVNEVAQIYENLGTNALFQIIMISQICREKRMSKQDIQKALDIAKHGELERLQLKVEYLYNDVNRLEQEKIRINNQISNLNRMKGEAQSFLLEKRGQMMENYYSNQGTGFYNNNTRNNPSYPPLPYSWYDKNADILYPTPSTPSYSKPEPVDELRSISIKSNRNYAEASLSLCYRPIS
jgi:hypothetical protein